MRAASPEEKGPQARYVYAVIPHIDKDNFGPIGIEGNTVYTISCEDISAVVHDCPAEAYMGDEGKVKEMVATHGSVVDAAWEEAGSILPMSFDVIVRTDGERSAGDNVRKWLEDEHETFNMKLDEFRDKVELGVQIFWDPEVITRQIAEENEEITKLMAELATKSRGAAYFYQHSIEDAVKKEMAAKADRDYRSYYRRLRVHAEDIEVSKIKREENRQMIMNSSLLVKRGNVRALGETLAEIGEEDGVEVRFTGPWPPYTFAANIAAIGGKAKKGR
ncbi:MAG: GvpL/GvpF family gas vesicle protein [Chloroflexota bacterium]|nr:GvpL/GvpF family gas vesicle protein [Anaerolineae bacterium]